MTDEGKKTLRDLMTVLPRRPLTDADDPTVCAALVLGQQTEDPTEVRRLLLERHGRPGALIFRLTVDFHRAEWPPNYWIIAFRSDPIDGQGLLNVFDNVSPFIQGVV